MHVQFATVLTAVLPIFFIAGAGIFLRKINWLTEDADKSLLRITINVFSPALIFDSVLHNEALKVPGNVVLAPLVGFGTVALGMLFAFFTGKLVRLQDRRVLGTFALCAGIYNYGYVPIPLATTLFNRETVGVLFVHNVGVEIGLWTIGLILLAGSSSARGWKNIINAPVIAIVIALALNFLHAEKYIPDFVMLGAKMLGQCLIPIGVLMIGATIADHMHEFHSAHGWRVIVTSCVVRLGLLPLSFLLLAKFLPCSVELKRVIVIQAAMPSANFPIVMAKHYNGDAPTALRVVIGTSVVGLLTIPLWIQFGMKMVFG